MNSAPFVPALRFHFLTRAYDPVVSRMIGHWKLRDGFIEAIDAPQGASVLDVGCGTGTLLSAMASRRPDLALTGVDLDPRALRFARAKLPQSLSVRLQTGSATKLPFPDAEFDRVVTSLMLHHLRDEQKALAFGEMKRVLKPGGELHVCDWGPGTSVAMKVAFLSVRLLDGLAPTRANARGELPAMIARAGFERVELHRRFATAFGELTYIRARKS